MPGLLCREVEEKPDHGQDEQEAAVAVHEEARQERPAWAGRTAGKDERLPALRRADPERERVTRPGPGHVRDPPGAVELAADPPVDRGQGLRARARVELPA